MNIRQTDAVHNVFMNNCIYNRTLMSFILFLFIETAYTAFIRNTFQYDNVGIIEPF